MRTSVAACTPSSPATMSNVPPVTLTNPRVASSSLFDLMPSPPASMSNVPPSIFTQSFPRSASSTAVMQNVPPVTTGRLWN